MDKKSALSIIAAVVIALLWAFPLHELGHYAACRLQGYEATSNFYGLTECPGIVNAPGFGFFLYAFAPYLVDLVAIAIVFYLRGSRNEIKDTILKVLPFVIMFDALGNYIGSLGGRSDFVLIIIGSREFFWPSAFVVAIISFLGVMFYWRMVMDFRKALDRRKGR